VDERGDAHRDGAPGRGQGLLGCTGSLSATPAAGPFFLRRLNGILRSRASARKGNFPAVPPFARAAVSFG